MMAEVMLEPCDVLTAPPPPPHLSIHPSTPQTWWSLPLSLLPRPEQFHPGEHIQLARLLVGTLAVARAAAAAARVRLLPLARLPLLADEGAGDGRCPGHADCGARRGCASPALERGEDCSV